MCARGHAGCHAGLSGRSRPSHTSCTVNHPPHPQVNAILRDLVENGALTNAHLDQLWGVTEQEGTYEGVKAHVYEGLAELVGAFSPDQVRAPASMLILRLVPFCV